MASIPFKFDEDQRCDKISAVTIDLLSDYLQPNSTLRKEVVSEDIRFILPAEKGIDGWSSGCDSLASTILDFAEQIPYNHPSQLKLADFMKVTCRPPRLASEHLGRIVPFEQLTIQMREYEGGRGPDEDEPIQWVNFHAFVANHIGIDNHPGWAIVELRMALEGEERTKSQVCQNVEVMAAAQYILYQGQVLFKHIIFLGGPDTDELNWNSGPLYHGEPQLSLDRWRFWKDAFIAFADRAGDEKDEKAGAYDSESRDVASRAADLMDSIEHSMTFIH